MEHHETPTPIIHDAVYTPDDVARILACSRTHVYRLMNSGALGFVDISAPESETKKARIRGSELNDFLDRNVSDTIVVPEPTLMDVRVANA